MQALPAIIAVASIGYNPLVAPACGPFFPEIIFTNTLHPDLPIGPYTNGELGVIQPGYADIFLYVAYRNLMGIPFTPADQDALWGGRPALTTKANAGLAALASPSRLQTRVTGAAGKANWIQEWASASGESPAAGGAMVTPEGIFDQVVRPQHKFEFYSQFLNCPQDAFREALSTLKRQRQQFGNSSPITKSWIDAQNQVFENCAGRPSIPPALPASAPLDAREDRAYQIAAAYFYSRQYDKAADAFRAIAQDTSSPWNLIAPYLVARALVRKATMGSVSDLDLGALAEAESQVDSVLANRKYAQYHHAARQLQGFIEFRLHPRKRLVELAKNLMQPRDPDLSQDATDFTLLIGRLRREPPPGFSGAEKYNALDYLASARSESDLIDWMLTMKQVPSKAFNHAFAKWQVAHSQAWLVAALTFAAPVDPQAPELLHAAAGVTPSSPAYASAAFQSLRLMLLQGKTGQVRERLSQIVAGQARGARLPRSTVNLLLALQLECARNLGEFLKSAPRLPATVTSGDEPDDMPTDLEFWQQNYRALNLTWPQFDDDSLVVLNRYLRLSALAKAAKSGFWPGNLRREAALAAWTRAALLGDSTIARTLGPEVERDAPELKPGVQAYESAAGVPAKRFAAAFTFLRFPGLRPYITRPARATPIAQLDMYRDNWWRVGGPCQLNGQYWSAPEQVYFYPPRPAPPWPQLRPVLAVIYPGGHEKPPAFLSTAERADAAREWRRLTALGTAPDYLSREVIAWAKAHPHDSRVPEALALAVKSTHYGCADKETGSLSRKAFDLLHRNYPNSPWAKGTKYWYKF